MLKSGDDVLGLDDRAAAGVHGNSDQLDIVLTLSLERLVNLLGPRMSRSAEKTNK